MSKSSLDKILDLVVFCHHNEATAEKNYLQYEAHFVIEGMVTAKMQMSVFSVAKHYFTASVMPSSNLLCGEEEYVRGDLIIHMYSGTGRTLKSMQKWIDDSLIENLYNANLSDMEKVALAKTWLMLKMKCTELQETE